MILLNFRIRRPAGFGALTADRPDTVLHLWCNMETDFVQVLGANESETRATMEAILRRFGPSALPAPAHGEPRAALIPCPADPKASVSRTVERHAGLVQPPIVSAQGWDSFRVVVFDDAQAAPLLAALQKLGEFELLAKRPLNDLSSHGFFVPSNEVLGSLTRRQTEAVVVAASQGYYEEPRATTLAAVAARVGQGRASLEEHLRKAENKILKALLPFLSVHATALRPTKARGRPFAGNNRRHGKESPKTRSPRGKP